MVKLNIEINTDLALKPLKDFLSHIPDNKVIERVWEIATHFLPKVIYNAITNLSNAIQNPNIKGIDKTNPFIETSYPVELCWDEIKANILEQLQKLSDNNKTILTHIPLKNRQEQILNLLNRNRIAISKDDIELHIPEEYIECKNLINGDIPQVLLDTATPTSLITFKGEFVSKKLQFEGVIFVMFAPLLVIERTQEIRFPIFAGLKTTNNFHQSFTKRQEKTFWEIILKQLKETFKLPGQKDNELTLEQNLTEPKAPILKSAMHLEGLKHGRKPDPQLKLPFEEEGKPAIEFIGLNLDKKHYHALNAIQKFFQETRYKGNVPGRELDGKNSFQFKGTLPRIRISKAEYLEAYGVEKLQTSRGKWEFSGSGQEEAFSALRDLHTQNHLIICRKKRWENGEELIDRIQTIAPIIRIYEGWEGLTKREDELLSENIESNEIKKKHAGFLIEPCPLMIDQIDKYFLLKPANMYQEIKLKFPNASKYAYAFIDWILHEAHQKKGKSSKKDWPEFIEVSEESLVIALRLDGYIKTRNKKRINQILEKCIQIAIYLGWISKHEITKGKTVAILQRFYLNKQRFEGLHKAPEKIAN